MTRKDPVLLVEDILEAMNKIEDYISGMEFQDFKSNSMAIDAVLRNLEVIGEASNNLPSNILSEYSEVPWKRMIGLRNIVIHEYFGVDLNIIWRIITKDIPETKPELEEVLEDLE